MDEGSSGDDDNAFVSASEDDDEIDFEKRSLRFSSPFIDEDLPSLRSVSPALSNVSSRSFLGNRRSKKRPAPQPPSGPVEIPPATSTPMVKVTTEMASSDTGVMASFAREFHKAVDDEKIAPESSEKIPIGKVASHPIVISSEKGKEDEFVEGPKKAFSNLRIRMIDESETTNTPPASASSVVVSPLYGLPSSAQQSTILGMPSSASPTAPFYVASVKSTSIGTSVSLPQTPSIIHALPDGGNQYVTIAPFGGYMPQAAEPHRSYHPLMGVDDSGLRSSVSYVSSAMSPPSLGRMNDMQGSSGRWNALAHSASDPGITKGSLLLTPNDEILGRLSEIEEDSYEEVAVMGSENSSPEMMNKRRIEKERRNENFTQTRTTTTKGRKRRGPPPPLERSDSMTVAHLYEDIIVSSRWNFKVTFTNLTFVVLSAAIFMPNSAALLYNLFRLVFGTLFPAYYSYKAVRTKNVKEYVKWMMYWIVFAFFTCAETITDVFFSFWFPFYYEIKILVVLWLLSPATRGSSILYRKFVHPWLTKKEEEIDDCIAKAKQQGYSTVVQLGTKGVNYATNVIMQTAIKGGGGLVSQLKRSYSTSEIGEDTADHNRNLKSISHKELPQSPSEDDDVSMSSGSYESEPRHRTESESLSSRPRGHSTGRSVRTGKARSADVSEVYFHETQEPVTQRRSPRTHDAGRTGDSSGHTVTTRRSRSGDVSYATLPRTTSKRTSVKKRQA